MALKHKLKNFYCMLRMHHMLRVCLIFVSIFAVIIHFLAIQGSLVAQLLIAQQVV
jgi:hypothetical protein